jgi:hypothetical protein
MSNIGGAIFGVFCLVLVIAGGLFLIGTYATQPTFVDTYGNTVSTYENTTEATNVTGADGCLESEVGTADCVNKTYLTGKGLVDSIVIENNTVTMINSTGGSCLDGIDENCTSLVQETPVRNANILLILLAVVILLGVVVFCIYLAAKVFLHD